jgi:PAS domain S-box-containing protein
MASRRGSRQRPNGAPLGPARPTERDTRHLKTVQRITDASLAHLALGDLLNVLLEHVRSSLRADTAVVLLLDNDEQNLVVRASVGFDLRGRRWRRVPLGAGFTGRVAAERRAIAVEDVDTLDLVNPVAREQGVRSVLGAPLLVEGRLLGVLSVGSRRTRRFRRPTIELLQAVADRVALAIDRARLFRELQVAVREREDSLALLDTLLDRAPVGLAFVDRDLRFVKVNEALATIDGVPVEQHLGRTVSEAVPDLAAFVEPLYRHVLETGEPIHGREVSGETAASPGERRYFLASYYPVGRTPGRPLGVGVVVNEITERKREEEARAQLSREQGAREAALRRSARLHALHEAALAFAAPPVAEPASLIALAEAILQRAVGVLAGRSSWLVLADLPSWSDLLNDAEAGEGLLTQELGQLPRRSPVRSAGATRHVLDTGSAVWIPDTSTAGPFGPYPDLTRRGIHSFALLPLRAGDVVLGALGVNFADADALTEDDRAVLDLLAAHAAAALDRVRRAHAERQRAERLAATLAAVGAAPDLESSLVALLHGAVALLGGDYAVAYVYGPLTAEVPPAPVADAAHPPQSSGETPGGYLMLRVDADGSIGERTTAAEIAPGSFAAALLSGAPPQLVEDFWALDPNRYSRYSVMRQRGVRSAVNVPIEAAETRIGSLHVNHRSAGYFGPADLALAGALATQAGATIERARLEAERLHAVRQIAAQAEEIARREADAIALHQLARLKDELLWTVSHELRTPLTVVHGYAHRLRARGPTLDAQTIVSTASNILESASQLTRIVDDLLDFGRLERGRVELRPEEFEVGPVLEESLVPFRRRPGGERLTWEVPPGATVYADRTRFVQIVSNLVENAVKYAPHGPITVRARPRADTLRLEVIDRGPGIDRREHARVWEKFYRGAGVAELNVARGAGIGLAVVKDLVEAHGGQVGLESTAGGGARFWLDLPSYRVSTAA